MDSGFQLVRSNDVAIEGIPGTELVVRAGGRTLGSLRGFIVERSHERIRYVLVRASGLFGKSTLLPFSDPRVDFGARAIDLDIDDRTLWQLRDFTPKQLLTT